MTAESLQGWARCTPVASASRKARRRSWSVRGSLTQADLQSALHQGGRRAPRAGRRRARCEVRVGRGVSSGSAPRCSRCSVRRKASSWGRSLRGFPLPVLRALHDLLRSAPLRAGHRPQVPTSRAPRGWGLPALGWARQGCSEQLRARSRTITGRPSRGLIVGIWRIESSKSRGSSSAKRAEDQRRDRAHLQLAEAHPDARARTPAEGNVGALWERRPRIRRKALRAKALRVRRTRPAGGARPTRSSSHTPRPAPRGPSNSKGSTERRGPIHAGGYLRSVSSSTISSSGSSPPISCSAARPRRRASRASCSATSRAAMCWMARELVEHEGLPSRSSCRGPRTAASSPRRAPGDR